MSTLIHTRKSFWFRLPLAIRISVGVAINLAGLAIALPFLLDGVPNDRSAIAIVLVTIFFSMMISYTDTPEFG